MLPYMAYAKRAAPCKANNLNGCREVIHPPVCVLGQELERVDEYKYLGVTHQLNWNYHICVTAGKISQRLGILRWYLKK